MYIGVNIAWVYQENAITHKHVVYIMYLKSEFSKLNKPLLTGKISWRCHV